MSKEEEVIKQEEAIVEKPKDSVIVETAEDDRKAIGFEPEQKKQESKPKEEDTPTEVKEEANESKEVTPKKNRAQRKIERQNQEIRELREANEKLSKESKANKAKNDAPSPADFETLEDYTEALEKYKVPPKEEDKKDSKIDARIAEMTRDGNEDHEDFDELIRAEDFPLSGELLENVLDSEEPSEVIYYLAKNKELTKKIARMNEKGRQKEILKIEIALEEKPKAKVVKASKAPEPINALNGGTESVRTARDATTYAEYESLRHKSKRNAW